MFIKWQGLTPLHVMFLKITLIDYTSELVFDSLYKIENCFDYMLVGFDPS